VKIPSAEILQNVGHLLPDNQLAFVATDERNKTFFKAFKSKFPAIKFLDDYMDIADLRSINPNFLGMIDQVICTRSSLFVGTWFSTFTGYITRYALNQLYDNDPQFMHTILTDRMRGYLGYHDYTNYYGTKKHRDRFHHDELPKFPFYMREWNVSWYRIDDE
jgi:hypothetical protein